MNRYASLCIALAAVAVTAGCTKSATQIVVAVDTTLGIPCEVDALEIDFAGPASMDGVGRQSLVSTSLPATVTLVPESGTPEVVVDVRLLAAGTVAATATATVAFVDGGSRLLHIVLDDTCAGTGCTFDQSDLLPFEGVPAAASPTSCTDSGPPTDGGMDSGAPVDSGADACVPTSETCDGEDQDCDGDVDEDMGLCGPGEACEGGVCVEQVERYTAETTDFEVFQSACSSVGFIERTLVSADEMEADFSMELPFPFEYYGEEVAKIWVGDNGYVTFGAAAPERTAPILRAPLDDPQAPRPGVSVFWDGLETSAMGVCFASTGVEGAKRLIITWEEACFERVSSNCTTANRLSFSVIIEQGTNKIYFVYGPMIAEPSEIDRARGQTATIGVANEAAVGCPHADCSLMGLCGDGTPCGYTQAAYRTTEPMGVPNRVFTPVEGL